MRTIYDSRHLDAVRADEFSRATSYARRASAAGVVPPPSVQSSLSGINIPVERFTHNNMVPFFGGSVKQNTGETAYTSRLEAFTGTDADVPYGKKLEQAPLFSPRQDDLFGVGVDVLRDAFLETMEKPRNRAFENPAPQVVGRPGVAGGKTGDVYYDAREAQMPRNVDDMRVGSNPRLTFGGRVLPGLGTTTSRPNVSQMDMHRQSVVREQTQAHLLRTTGAVTKEVSRPQEIAKDTARQTTSRQYIGAPGNREGATARDAEGRSPFRSVLPGPQHGPASAKVAQVTDYGKSAILVYGNERDKTTTRIYQGNLVTAVKAIVAPLQDLVRGTRKEEFTDAHRAFGNIGGGVVQPKLTAYDAEDVARTTIKEAGIASVPNANFRGPTRITVYDPEDVARTTMRETGISEVPRFNLRGSNKQTVRNPEDTARTTLKETGLSSVPNTNLRGFNKQTAYDPADAARTTLKETGLASVPNANLRGFNKQTAYDPADAARITLKETGLASVPNANLRGFNKQTAYDPEDAARTTLKETGLASLPNTNLRGFNKQTAYDPEDAARTTLKETGLASLPNTNLRGSNKQTAYDPEDVARTTQKETQMFDGTAGSAIYPGVHAGRAVEPDDYARTTGRQTVREGDTVRNMKNAQYAGTAYDADDWKPAPTHKQVLTDAGRGDYADGNVGGLQGQRGGAYATAEYTAKMTHKQLIVDNGTTYGGVKAEVNGAGYLVAPDDVRDTQRQVTSDVEYYGGSGSAQTGLGQMSYDAALVARTNEVRELLSQGRDPTATSVKLAAGVETIGQQLRNPQRADLRVREVQFPVATVQITSNLVGDLGDVQFGRNTYDASSSRLEDEVRGAAAQLAMNPFALQHLQS